MTPINPVQTASADPKPPAAPPYIDNNPNLDLFEIGIEVAENELRDTINDAYQDAAGDSEERLNNIDQITSTEV